MQNTVLTVLTAAVLLYLSGRFFSPARRFWAVLPAAAGTTLFVRLVAGSSAAAAPAVPLLLAVVFAGMTLRPLPLRSKKMFRSAFNQFAYGQLLAWGQYPLSFALYYLLAARHQPISFALVLPVGFEGGHAVAAAAGAIWSNHGWQSGGDLALVSATVGLTAGMGTGLLLLRLFAGKKKSVAAKLEKPSRPAGLLPAAVRLSAALVLAWGVQTIVLQLIPQSAIAALLQRIPLFPWALPAGYLVRRLTPPLQPDPVQFCSDQALALLVTVSLAGISWRAAGESAGLLLLFAAAGLLWNLCCFLLIAPRVLGSQWVARGLAELGQSTGVTSAGLFLLRSADPDNSSGNLEMFAAKQLFHEPLMGGGLWTFAAIGLVLQGAAVTVLGISAVVCCFWGAVLFYRSMG